MCYFNCIGFKFGVVILFQILYIYIYNKHKMEVVLTKPKKPDKKYDARIDGNKTVSFGQKGASNFTKHKHPDRTDRYIDRHTNNEDWTKSCAKTAGFYSKHVLWNKPT